MKPTKRRVATWLLELMARQAPQSVVDAKRNTETATPAFVARFDAAAFCQQSQDAIAGSVRFWNEAVVSTALDVWCKENLGTPDEFALPAEAEAAPLSGVGKFLFARFLRAEDDTRAIAALGLMYSVDPAAFNWVVNGDMRAADLVVSRNWRVAPSSSDLAADWDNEEVVRQQARQLMAFYHDAADRQSARDPGLGSFTNFSATVWSTAATALTGALTANARHLLPVLQEEMTAGRYAGAAPSPAPRSGLFGG